MNSIEEAEKNTDLDYQLAEYLDITIDELDKIPIEQVKWMREKMDEGELEEISVAAEEMGL